MRSRKCAQTYECLRLFVYTFKTLHVLPCKTFCRYDMHLLRPQCYAVHTLLIFKMWKWICIFSEWPLPSRVTWSYVLYEPCIKIIVLESTCWFYVILTITITSLVLYFHVVLIKSLQNYISFICTVGLLNTMKLTGNHCLLKW